MATKYPHFVQNFTKVLEHRKGAGSWLMLFDQPKSKIPCMGNLNANNECE